MIIINLMSNKKGEIKKFLDLYYNGNSKVDEDISEWIYIYNKPVEAIKIIDSFVNKGEKFKISLWVQVGEDDLTVVDKHNKDLILGKIKIYK